MPIPDYDRAAPTKSDGENDPSDVMAVIRDGKSYLVRDPLNTMAGCTQAAGATATTDAAEPPKWSEITGIGHEPAIIAAESCAGCLLWDANDLPAWGNCRRLPPTPVFDPIVGFVVAQHPVTKADAWCGEFKSRAVKERVDQFYRNAAAVRRGRRIPDLTSS